MKGKRSTNKAYATQISELPISITKVITMQHEVDANQLQSMRVLQFRMSYVRNTTH